jgi:hypothetical protein
MAKNRQYNGQKNNRQYKNKKKTDKHWSTTYYTEY